jgi:hypothetical protein
MGTATIGEADFSAVFAGAGRGPCPPCRVGWEEFPGRHPNFGVAVSAGLLGDGLMSEQLHEAAERARLERRRRLVREVTPYLEPDEHVLDATTGRGARNTPGSSRAEAAVLRVVATERRLLVLRKKAFRHFVVQAFGYQTARVSLGFTAEAGGEIEIVGGSSSVRVIGVPEMDLEPFFLICEMHMDPSRLAISLAEPPASLAAAREPFADEDTIRIPELEAAEVSLSSDDDAWSFLSMTPRSQPPEPEDDVRIVDDEAGDAPATEPGTADEDEPTEPGSRVFEMPPIVPDPESSLEQAAGQVQASVLRWLLVSTGARAAAYLSRSGSGEDRLQMEPRRLDAHTAMSMVRLATDVLDRPAEQRPATVRDLTVARWGGSDGERVLILAGAERSDDTSIFGRFVLEWLDSHSADSRAKESPPREDERPRLISLDLQAEEGERPAATVRLAWRGKELLGHGRGHTAVIGRHLAAARAVADALRPVVHGEMLVEHLSVTYPPMDAELVVTTVLVGAKRFVGATVTPPGDEESAAARAVLDALNRSLTQLDETQD